MRIVLLMTFMVVIGSVQSQSPKSSTCRAISLSGSGDRGAWQSGVISGLVKLRAAEDSQWDVVSGISGGSINAAWLSMYSKGQEIEAAEALVEKWMTITRPQVYVDWFGGIPEGLLLKDGLYDTTPLLNYLTANMNASMIAASDRELLIGATNLETGVFDQFDKSDPELVLGVKSSSSVPAIFPPVLP
eukprot:gene1378-1583_t